VLRGSELVVDPTGTRIDVGLPWYRSMPVSSITDWQIGIDGEVFDSRWLAVDLDGRLVDADGLVDHSDRYWFLQDRLPVVVRGWAPAPDAVEAAATLRMKLALPYMFAAPNVPIMVSMAAAEVCPIRRRES
jgi:hypothetical protein